MLICFVLSVTLTPTQRGETMPTSKSFSVITDYSVINYNGYTLIVSRYGVMVHDAISHNRENLLPFLFETDDVDEAKRTIDNIDHKVSV